MKRECIVMASLLIGIGSITSCTKSAPAVTETGPIGDLDRQINALETQKERYKSQAYFENDEGMRLETNNSDFTEARQDFVEASVAEAKVKELQAQIDALKKQKQTLQARKKVV